MPLSALSHRPAIRNALVLSLVLLALPGCMRVTKNFHTVDPGKLYRSAQLTGEEIDEAIATWGIRTIINLRGAGPGKEWYDEEKASAERNGVDLVDIRMSAGRIPHRDDLIKLLDTFKTAERPILAHCKAGADRTGEAVSIYMMEYMGRTKEEALEALDFDFWHIAFFTPAKTYFMGLYQGEAWAREVYDPCAPDQDYEYYDKEQYCPIKKEGSKEPAETEGARAGGP